MFGLLAGGYHVHLDDHPVRVVVVTDSSDPMQAPWSQALVALDGVDDRRYAEFSLFTEKNRVHDWQADLAPNTLSAYAPCDFDKLERLQQDPLLGQADQAVLVTNASAADLPDLKGRTILLVR